jgi:hypothetical protein
MATTNETTFFVLGNSVLHIIVCVARVSSLSICIHACICERGEIMTSCHGQRRAVSCTASVLSDNL